MPMEINESSLIEDSDDQSEDQASLKSNDSRGSNRVKFLYGYGGRILPRPGDGKLRYVGGETRVMAANRNITFADLIAKMGEVLGSSVVLKCQLPADDLDALVSIKSDEDLENLLEEYERLGVKEGSPKVRAFLYPKPPAAAARTCAGGHVDHRLNPPRGSYPTQQHLHETRIEARRHPRWPAVIRYPSPVRYEATMPPQQNSAGRAVATAHVDNRLFVLVDRSSCYSYHYTPPAQVRLPGMATQVPQSSYKYILHNSYDRRGFKGFPAHQQLLVQN